jgi:hypothetical protein
MTDLINALEIMAAKANWDPSLASSAENSIDVKAYATWALTGDASMRRALEGERMHVNIAPWVEADDADESSPSDDKSPKSEAPRAS